MKSFDKWFAQQGKKPTLGDIITDICGHIGINRADVDVSELDKELLPYGLSGDEGRYKFECRGCGRTCDYDGEPEDFNYDYAYGGCSPNCIP